MRRERERERTNIDLDIIFLIVCCSSRTCLFGIPSSQLHSGCYTPWLSSPKIGTVIFGRLHIVVASVQLSSFYLHVWCPTDFFLFPVLCPLTLLFFCWRFFQPIRTRQQFSIFNPAVRWYFYLDFPIHFSLKPFSLSVSLLTSIIFLKYVPVFSSDRWSTIKTID